MDCKNCGSGLRDKDGFCSDCGARVINERISFRFLFNEFLDKVLSIDNKLLKTFFHLFTKPEVIIDGYIQGVRKKYFNPVSYLLISITLTGIYFYFLKDIANDAIIAGTENISANDSENPFLKRQAIQDMMNFSFEYQAILGIMNIPVYAFISWLVFLNRKKYNFYEHIIIYLYALAQTSVLSFITFVPIYFIDKDISGVVSLVLAFSTFIYFAYVLIRLFALTFFQFIIKTMYFLVIASFSFLILGILMNVFMLLSIGPEEYLKQFAPNRQKKDSIQKVKTLDSLQKTKQIDSIQKLKKNDSIKKKEISFYEASSRLNCLS